MTSSFYSILYKNFSGVQIDPLFSARLLHPVNDPLPFVKVGRDISDCVVGIPPIQIISNRSNKDAVCYGPFSLEANAFGKAAAIKLSIASTSLLSAKSVISWLYHDYFKEWRNLRPDQLRASYVINLAFDFLARQRIKAVEGKEFYNNVLKFADLVSAFLLSHDSPDLPRLIQATIASLMFSNSTGRHVSGSILEMAKDFISKLNTFSDNTAQIIELHRDYRSIQNSQSEIKKKTEINWTKLKKLADALYSVTTKIPGVWHQVYLPYSNMLVDTDSHPVSIYRKKDITEVDFTNFCKSINAPMAKWNSSFGTRSDGSNSDELFEQMAKEQKQKDALQQKLAKLSQNLNFTSVGFPMSDYVTYYRLYASLMPNIRSMINQARSLRVVAFEEQNRESGNLDLQIAIQAVAGQKERSDMYERPDITEKSESWTILVDSSFSVRSSSEDVKAISVSLAEAAKEVIGTDYWGMYAFSDELQCIKDFSETYDDRIRARIGGLNPKGLSYIPDAIRATKDLIAQYSKDKNYVMLVSDGLPSGYPGIEQELTSSVREASSHGVDLAAVGVGSNKLKKVVQRSKIVNSPNDIVKEFLKVYYDLSST